MIAAHLVVDEVVERQHGPDEGGQVDDQHHVVRFGREGFGHLAIQVRQQVEHILHEQFYELSCRLHVLTHEAYLRRQSSIS